MRTFLIALVPTAALLFFLVAAQNPRREPPVPPEPRATPEVRVTPSEAERKEIARLTKAMQGLWVLKELDWSHLEGVSSEFRGFCMVSDNHLNFEVHIGLRGQNEKLNDVMLDSGLWRFEISGTDSLLLVALIGSFIDKDNRVAFRAEGTQCRYEVLALGEQMVWRKEDGQRLVFERTLDLGPSRVDIFGRPLPEKPEKKDGDAKQPDAKKEPRKDGGG